MKAGFFYTFQRQAVYYRFKRQIVAEFQIELRQATGLKKMWLRWQRRVAIAIRYDQLLFSTNQPIA